MTVGPVPTARRVNCEGMMVLAFLALSALFEEFSMREGMALECAIE